MLVTAILDYDLFFSVDVTNVWGHVNMFAKGAGQAVAQLDLTYGIDYEPFKVTPLASGTV